MPRASSQTFKCQSLADLTVQLLYAPVKSKLVDQILRAERLHDQIESEAAFPLDYIVYRITGVQSAHPSETVLVGDAILPDLRLMIDQLTRSAQIVMDPDEPIESTRQLAARLAVSTKTIDRWRKVGLRWRWVLHEPTGRAEIGIPRDAIDHFIKTHTNRVKRASKFTKIDSPMRRRIIERARRIRGARAVTLNQVATHLARRIGRALESVRRILEEHDQGHPDQAIFVHHTGPLDVRQRQEITQNLAQGDSIEALAQQFGRSTSTIYRVVRERRAAELRKVPLRFAKSPLYERPDADQVILRPDKPGDDADATKQSKLSMGDLPEMFAGLLATAPLKVDQQRSLLVKFNYLKYKAVQLRDHLDPYEPRVTEMDQIDRLLDQINQSRGRLVAVNLSVVLKVARQQLADVHDHSRSVALLLHLFEEGVGILIESIEAFDPGRKKEFGSYLNWNLARRYARDTATQSDMGRAVRRQDPKDVLKRILDLARDHDADLQAYYPADDQTES